MSALVRSLAVSLQVLLEGAIDYAGLFAPASLDMTTCVNNYSRYRSQSQSWALGRFVLPVARLDEFLGVQKPVSSEPWHLCGIVSASVASDLAAVDVFNRKPHGAVINSVEARVCNGDEIDQVYKHRPAGTAVLFEISPERSDELLPVLRQIGAGAKLRTGGVVAEAFPALEAVAGFLARCAELDVPFKATAGLHHPLRCMRPFTYEPDSPEGMMHGFLNLFTASAIAWNARRSGGKAPLVTLATCLADRERANWHFGDDALIWSGEEKPVRIDLESLRALRSKFALSFGSCSFEEPMRELSGFGLL